MDILEALPDDWRAQIEPRVDADEMATLGKLVAEEYATGEVFPREQNIFKAFELCSFDQTRAVILGQDPYPGSWGRHPHAHGLCFSVPDGVPLPDSLRNIYAELAEDLATAAPTSGDLTPWAEQGVLLLNTSLTVRAGDANSHAALGWNAVTDAAISALSARSRRVVFTLWGNHAHKKARIITGKRSNAHVILKATHPSPLGANRKDAKEQAFFGSKAFSTINEFVVGDPIRWA